MLLKDKKGLEAGGLSLIIAIIILFLGAGTIWAGIKYASTKVDEKFQVSSCRLFNELKFEVKEATAGVLTSGEATCYTIDKHSDEKAQIPTSNKYKQDKEGGELEIREMVKDCWHMWLDGSKKDMFKGYPFTEPCFTCYTFKIKGVAKGVTFDSLSDSMEEPYYVKDKSDKCSEVGGFWREKCNPDEKIVASKKTPPNSNLQCCAKEAINECENLGGKCSSEGKPSEEYGLYALWSCPKRSQSCYVKKNDIFSYTRYIRESSERGGDVFFIPPEGEQSNTNLVPGELYAISFVSPNKQVCFQGIGETSGVCYAAIGGYAIGTVLGGAALVKYAGIKGVVTVGTKVGAKTLKMIGIKGGAKIGLTYYLGILDNILDSITKGTANLAVKGIADEVPNFIIVSTLNHAKEIGCTQSYSG